MAIQYYDIDEAQVRLWFPNVRIAADAPLTPGVVQDIIDEACGQASARLQAAGVDDSQINVVDWPVAYHTMRKLVKKIMKPDLLERAHHPTTQAADLDTWEENAQEALTELAQFPERYVGALFQRKDTSTANLGLRTDEGARDRRREFDQVTLRKDGKNDFFYW